jgi:hypothetical protein
MKNLICAALMIVGLSSFAQEMKSGQRQQRQQLTTEQRNELHLKKLTLDLDLNASQQKEVSKILAEQSAKRKTIGDQRKADRAKAAKLTANERFEMKKQMMDQKMAEKQKIKSILTPAQYEKWEKMQNKKRGHSKKRAAMHMRKAKHTDKK